MPNANLAAPGAAASGQASQSTYFPGADLLPPYLKQLVDALGANAQSSAGQYNDYISNPTASPLFQNTLQGLLAALAPGETQARQQYNDQGVAAGNRSSGAFATGGAKLEGDLQRNRQTTASQVLAQQFPQMVQALLQPQQLASQLMQAMKLSQGFGAQPGVGGAGGGGGGGNGLQFSTPQTSRADWEAQLAGYPNAAEYQASRQRDALTGLQPPAAAAAPGAPAGNIGEGGSTMFMPNGDYVSGGSPSTPPWSPPGAGGGSSQFSDFRPANPGEFSFGQQNGALEW